MTCSELLQVTVGGKSMEMRGASVDDLIRDFAAYLDCFVETTPVDANFQSYLTTVRLRRAVGSVANALASDEFMKSLHKTMSGFFRLGRWKLLLPEDELTAELRKHSGLILPFDGMKLSTEPLETGDKLWEVINIMKLTKGKKKNKEDGKEDKGKTKLVSGTKALHLLLPDLVVPIDRRYTGAFFYRYDEDFDRENEQQMFRLAFAIFRKIARAVTPEAYIGTHEVHANRTKVIDNGIMAYVDRARREFQKDLTEMQIEEVAYGLFEKRGRLDGGDLKDWFEAETILHKNRKLAG
jgi:hypothetical protein